MHKEVSPQELFRPKICLFSFPGMVEKLFEKQQEGSSAEENSQETEDVRKRKGEEDQGEE